MLDERDIRTVLILQGSERDELLAQVRAARTAAYGDRVVVRAVHELAHISHERRTPGFWAVVARALPDYEVRKNQLAIAGAKLWLG